MICSGGFGGYLNYLHNFDTLDKDSGDKIGRFKYILLGIGAAFLVPAFLKMISSNLSISDDNNDYLIFAGFCLIAAIFSRRFINTIGEKILEAAKNAEKSAQESKRKIENTQFELSTAKERIEDVKLAVDLKNAPKVNIERADNSHKEKLIELANSYVTKTSVPDYAERLRLKAELGRKMGEIIVRNNLSTEELLNHSSEGMILALSYLVQLKPSEKGLDLLKIISKSASQLYTKYSILVSFDTLARNSYINKTHVKEVVNIITAFQQNADNSLLRKIQDTLTILSLIGPLE
ncbi:hypothetical protein CA265_02180 [Sphingobacteriaceae bacterium GW460-11-11-14-LB5]|nr:hypothetical protein CA265_02180 [Sphingobacteriaceae bacterium GW460-11-11-14-LB5]